MFKNCMLKAYAEPVKDWAVCCCIVMVMMLSCLIMGNLFCAFILLI